MKTFTLPFDAFVIYGWFEGLKEWHLASIVPVNFTLEQTKNMKDLSVAAVNLACGHSKVGLHNKGNPIPEFVEFDELVDTRPEKK